MVPLHAAHTATPTPAPVTDAVLVEGLLGLIVSAVAFAGLLLSWWCL